MFPLAWPYPPEQLNGYWGPTTATIDWCEENYVVLPYIADAINTTTNLMFFLLSGIAIYNTIKQRMDQRFVWMAMGFMLVGIGLWLFHMTLRYEYQLLDELPMIYATCIPFWLVFSEFKTQRQLARIGGAIFMAANVLSLVYMYIYKNPTLHQAAYGVLNAAIILKLMVLTQQHVTDRHARQQLMKTMYWGVGLFLLGYVLWNLDIHLCGFWRNLRRSIGQPYGFILEGHGWWHIFTGSGVYYYLVYEQYLRLWLQGTQKFYKFTWVGGWLPMVILQDPKGLTTYRNARKLAQADEEFLKSEKSQ